MSEMLFTDQLNRTIDMARYPKRIVSLVPSQSELLWDLGLQQELVGITKFCIHPNTMYKTIAHIGGTKTLHIDKIKALNPDLIIGNKEENEQSQIEQLASQFPVWLSDINNLDDAYTMIQHLGIITNKQQESTTLIDKIKTEFNALDFSFGNKTVTYLIWKNPYMAAGHSTFINSLLELIGLKNIFTHLPSRYPEISIDDLLEQQPDVIFLSSEPYPFKEQHITELQAYLPKTIIKLVDGEAFSWYGSRLLYTPNYLKTIKASIN